MKPELPKTVRDALASGTASPHPSADMLAAFVENALHRAERERVTEHLSHCVECREVVFLTSSLSEEEGVLIPRIAASAASTPATQEPDAQTATPMGPPIEPRQRWGFRIGWAIPIAAVAVAVVGGILLYRRWEASSTAPQLTSTVSSTAIEAPPPQEQAVPAFQSEAEVAAAKPARKPAAGPVQSKSVAKSAQDMAGVGSPTIHGQESASVQLAENKPQAATNQPAATAVAAPVQSEQPKASAAAPAPATAPGGPQHGAAGLSGAFAAHAKNPSARLSMSPSVAQGAVTLTPSTWRIGKDGQLQHFTQGVWTRALANEPTVFRAVAVVGNSVWAGGSGNALLHSSDSGQNWDRVALPPSDHNDGDSIVSIQFQDPQRGTIATQSGLVFATTDGGAKWTKQ